MVNYNYVKFVRGTVEEFQTFRPKDEDTLYFLHDEEQDIIVLYLGEKLVDVYDKTVAVDALPTEGSELPVSSDGVWRALQEKLSKQNLINEVLKYLEQQGYSFVSTEDRERWDNGDIKVDATLAVVGKPADAAAVGQAVAAARAAADSKQAKLISGNNIKTINNQSILGEGNIEIIGDVTEEQFEEELSKKQNVLTQGDNVTIENDTISVSLPDFDNLYYKKTDVDDLLNDKQDMLTQGENVKIENNTISVELPDFDQTYYTKTKTDELLAAKQDNLTAGDNVDITDGVVSVALPDFGKTYYTKTEVDTALAAKQSSLTPGQNIDIAGDGTISATVPQNVVQYTEQELTDDQKAQVRQNINAFGLEETVLVNMVETIETKSSGLKNINGISLLGIGDLYLKTSDDNLQLLNTIDLNNITQLPNNLDLGGNNINFSNYKKIVIFGSIETINLNLSEPDLRIWKNDDFSDTNNTFFYSSDLKLPNNNTYNIYISIEIDKFNTGILTYSPLPTQTGYNASGMNTIIQRFLDGNYMSNSSPLIKFPNKLYIYDNINDLTFGSNTKIQIWGEQK